MPDILGLILAGGKATRFGGGDKSLRPFQGRPLLAHTKARLGAQVAKMALSANGDATRFSDFDMEIVSDPVWLTDAGPVAGLIAGLTLAEKDHFDYLLTVPCDAPLFPEDLATCLLASLVNENADCARAASDGQAHPVFALWRTGTLDQIASECRNNVRALWRLQSVINTVEISFPALPFDPFRDADTAYDLQQLEELARQP
ncbi:MAG: molybdenum cofactor guanylyltransferase [Parvibaculum sp.]